MNDQNLDHYTFSMKKSKLVEVISALLLLFYVHSVISIYVQLQSLKNMLAFYTVHTSLVAWSFVIIETAIVLLLFFARTRTLGFVLSTLFAIALMVATQLTPGYPHDYGGLFNIISTKLKWALLALITVLSLAGVVLGYSKTKPSLPPTTVYT